MVEDFTPGEMWDVIKAYNYFDTPGNPSSFKSLRVIGKMIEKSPSPSRGIERLLAKMVHLGLLKVRSDDYYFFDVKAFDSWFEDTEQGRLVWGYISRQVEYIRK